MQVHRPATRSQQEWNRRQPWRSRKRSPMFERTKTAPVVSQKAKSEIELPIVTPSPAPLKTPAPKPIATPSPKPSPKRTPSPTPKSKTKKSNVAKVTPTPSPKTHKSGEEQKKTTDDNEKSDKPKATPGASTNADGNNSSGASGSGGSSRASEFSWYARMLHDRFYSEWVQPTTSVPAGAKMSALVRIRIERDGRISKFTIIRPSGNLVVDESVQAVSKRVTQVEPLPAGLGAGNYYEVNINFELNPTQ